MSDIEETPADVGAEVEVEAEAEAPAAPKGAMSIEDALQEVRSTQQDACSIPSVQTCR